MQLSALAEALFSSRRPNGAVSLQALLDQLSGPGLEEYRRAAAALAMRETAETEDSSDDKSYPWV